MEVINNANTPYNEGVLYGFCRYNLENCVISVLEKNISTFKGKGRKQRLQELKEIRLSKEDISKIEKTLEKISENSFYEIFNQSGMDHELIGHAYNYFSGSESRGFSEVSAVETQLEFAKERAKTSPEWKIILEIMPLVLGRLKNIPYLK